VSVLPIVGGGLIALGAIWVFVGWWLHYLASHGVDTVVDWGRAPASGEEARGREIRRGELQKRQFAVFDRSRWIAGLVVVAGIVLIVIGALR
jgi:hypothetical protein